MKRTATLILIFISLVLTGCSRELTCEDNQIKENDQCITVTANEKKLYESLSNSEELNNYTLTISINGNDERYDMQILFDGSNALIKSEDIREDYYIYNGNTCEHYSYYGDAYRKETYECGTEKNYKFFKEFEYTMFDLESGVFKLRQDYLIEVGNLLSEDESTSLKELSVSMDGDYITVIDYVLIIDSVEYNIILNITEIDKTNVSLPEVE